MTAAANPTFGLNNVPFQCPSTQGGTGGVITKSDTTMYNPPLRKIFVGGAGTLAITTNQIAFGTTGNQQLIFTSCIARQVLDVVAYQVTATGTSATNITASI